MTENSRLRVANSGPRAFAPDFATNVAVGRFLRCVANPDPLKPLDVRWEDVVSGITRFFYVDPTTTVLPANQNGNDESPYSTLTAALLNCTNPAGNYLILAMPSDYSAEVLPVAPAIAANRIVLQNVSRVFATGAIFAGTIVLPGWVCPATQLVLGGCTLTNTLQSNGLKIVDTVLDRVEVTGDFELYDSVQVNITFVTNGNIIAQHSRVTGEITATQTDPGLATFMDCYVGAAHYTSAAPHGVTHLVTYNSCTFSNSPVDTGGVADILSLTVLNTDCAAGTFDASVGGGVLDIDASSLATINEANIVGFAMPWGVRFRTQQARITVPVPAIVAAGLDYADVSAVGTPLEGILADTPILAHPTADLAAAGAGNGGYLNCRVSALNTIHLAFVGILAGGNVDFIFAQGGRAVP